MSTYKRELLIYLLSALVLATKVSAQSLPDSTIRKIDSLFAKWNTPNSPGCTVGIIRNNSIIFAKGYGMANLEYEVSNEPQTPFHMASISKQFTAYAIVLLARKGKLSLDDDVRKWLPWFPDLKEKITIRNLLNHTSGIRDQWQLLAISGTRLDDVITQDQIIKILSKQTALNFKPGDQYNYSNSGFTMLAEIVKSVSGQTLRKFTDSAIFKPLGMTKTHFHDDYKEIERNRSYSYDRIDSTHFSNAILSYSVAGATSLFTNINDMSKWIMNFYDHKVGDQKDIDQLTQKGTLNSGKIINYALGISNDTWHGWRQYSHGGSDAGYRTQLSVFPDLKMGFIVFSNVGDFNPAERLYKLADLFVKDTTVKTAATKTMAIDNIAAVPKDTSSVQKYLGNDISNEKSPFGFEIKDTSLTDEVLKTYTGVYFCPELDCKYGIVLKDHNLLLTNAKYNDTKLTLIGTEHLNNNYWWMNNLLILRDDKKNIIGFEVNSGRIMHLRFDKIEGKDPAGG